MIVGFLCFAAGFVLGELVQIWWLKRCFRKGAERLIERIERELEEEYKRSMRITWGYSDENKES